jgi:hypothetical protein
VLAMTSIEDSVLGEAEEVESGRGWPVCSAAHAHSAASSQALTTAQTQILQTEG